MARGHQRLGTAGAFGHDAQPEVGHQVRGRNAGGKLHRAGAKKVWEAAPPTVAKAVVVHLEKQETALEAEIVAGLARANALVKAARAVGASRALAAAAQAREDICNIVHVMGSVAEREAHVAQLFAAYGK